MRTRPTLVSVIIPAYNAASTIGRALQSVAEQDYNEIEIIVVDDASTDQTIEATHDARTRNTRIVRLTENSGASAARNRGIDEATGEYVAFLDSDDIWLPSKTSKQAQVLDQNPDVTLVTCDSLICNADGTVAGRSHEKRPPVNGPEAWRDLLASNFIPTPTVMARRRQVLDVGSFNTQFPVAEDLDLWIRLALAGSIATVQEVLVSVFVHPSGLMNRRRDAEHRCVFELVQRFLSENEHRLSRQEARRILGRRCFDFGANSFDHGLFLPSIPLFWRAAVHGYRPIKSVVNLPRAVFGHFLHSTNTAGEMGSSQ